MPFPVIERDPLTRNARCGGGSLGAWQRQNRPSIAAATKSNGVPLFLGGFELGSPVTIYCYGYSRSLDRLPRSRTFFFSTPSGFRPLVASDSSFRERVAGFPECLSCLGTNRYETLPGEQLADCRQCECFQVVYNYGTSCCLAR